MKEKQDVLDHKMRKIIFNYIASNPGVSFSSVKKLMDMNASTLRYHISYLEKNGKITSTKEGKHKCYYPVRRPDTNLLPIPGFDPATLTKTQQRVITLIKANPGICCTELAEIMKIKKAKVTYNVNKLLDKNIVWKVKGEDGIGYEFITESAVKEEIMRKLVERLLSDEIDEETFLLIKTKLDVIGKDDPAAP